MSTATTFDWRNTFGVCARGVGGTGGRIRPSARRGDARRIRIAMDNWRRMFAIEASEPVTGDLGKEPQAIVRQGLADA